MEVKEVDAEKTFGGYITGKRKEHGYLGRELAEKTGLSPGYYGDIEQNRRIPPEKGFLEKLIDIYNLTKEEQILLYDLAGKARKAVSPDLPEYIMENEVVRVALRLAKDKANASDWDDFIQKLKDKAGAPK